MGGGISIIKYTVPGIDLINLANSYANNARPANATGQWISRTGDVESNAVAYSYGGRRTIEEFNQNVATYGAPSKGILNGSADTDDNRNTNRNIRNYIQNYRGNIGDPPANANTTDYQKQYGVIGLGLKKWPGIYLDEYQNNNRNNQFYYEHWYGIDWIGLIVYGLRYASDPAQWRTAQQLGIKVGGVVGNDRIKRNITDKNVLDNTAAKTFFNAGNNNGDLHYYWEPSGNGAGTKLIHKGDMLRYKNKKGVTSHITNVYSDKAQCTTTGAGTKQEKTSNCKYEIIHAYGGDEDGEYTYPTYETDPALSGETVFARKVIRTWHDIKTPTGFGRIKLWD